MAEGETNECRRTRLRCRAIALLNGTSMLAAVTAAAILLETLLFPVLQIFGTSMAPALYEGDFVVAMRYVTPKRGGYRGIQQQ